MMLPIRSENCAHSKEKLQLIAYGRLDSEPRNWGAVFIGVVWNDHTCSANCACCVLKMKAAAKPLYTNEKVLPETPYIRYVFYFELSFSSCHSVIFH